MLVLGRMASKHIASRGEATFALDGGYFVIQSQPVQSNWASEHLQVIRTLMERAAIYRRALAPVMMVTGAIGSAAAVIALLAGVGAGRDFTVYWMAVGLAALAVAFLYTRRQALKDAEPFWSPPTRRVAQAMSPPLFVGMTVGLWGASRGDADVGVLVLPVWLMLYGCAVHAAGFFMPRGMKLFGWVILAGGPVFLVVYGILGAGLPRPIAVHGTMGAVFGALHLAYGIYLHFTERRKHEA
jgi:hypothetical protein